MRSTVILSALLGWIVSFSSVAEMPDLQQDISQRDRNPPNACFAAELEKLRESIFSAAQDRAPEVAWRLSKEMLCGMTKESERYVRSHMPKMVAVEFDTSTVEVSSTTKLMPSDHIHLYRQEAWAPTVTPRNNVIHIHYENGVCYSGFTIRYKGKTWLITGAGSSCG